LQNTKSQKKNQQMNQLATITYQTTKYLEETPCKNQTSEKVIEFSKAMESKKLTKAEKLTLLNLCPTTAFELQLVIFNFLFFTVLLYSENTIVDFNLLIFQLTISLFIKHYFITYLCIDDRRK